MRILIAAFAAVIALPNVAIAGIISPVCVLPKTDQTWTAGVCPADAHGKAVTGQSVTVWRKDPAGAWKGTMNIGTPD